MSRLPATGAAFVLGHFGVLRNRRSPSIAENTFRGGDVRIIQNSTSSEITARSQGVPNNPLSSRHACRLCGAALTRTFVDLGMSPLCESYVPPGNSDDPETFYPLHVRICEECLLVQLPAYVPGEDIFSDYAYFSSYSTSWVEHARKYAVRMIGDLGLTSGSLVTEVASNDGYLLRHFQAAGIPVLGVEPAANVAEAARARGIRTVTEFLGAATGAAIADSHGRADLVAGNNVFAHVPDILGFAAGLRALVKDSGLVTCEFPHLLRLIERRQYDTIYHEHYSYLSLLTASRALKTAGLRVTDVEELSTHGGSLRVHARPAQAAGEPGPRVKAVLAAEEAAGLHTVAGHAGFAADVLKIKSDLLGFLLRAAAQGRTVAGYGAPGKGNTLLNHCGIRGDLLAYTVDRSPVKQGRLLPGTRIPIHAPERLAETEPDYILVLPWNLRDEISEQLSYVRDWGGRLVFPIPRLEVV
ncbi:MAG: class I SAM-dependent methyltransferase [Nocardiopsaceae bacterium]|nr:class I SAM-dependent methyltransferase [Nocardiopsaceae bacterium]